MHTVKTIYPIVSNYKMACLVWLATVDEALEPGTVIGAELAQWLTGQRENLSIPTTLLRDIPFRELKRMCYEVGAHTYHLGQQTHALG
ncbi:hypothetical protein ONZ50_09855 [Marinomonas sp. GJ51-6]|nr:hypothetical protein [Marinomonas sp. GJ51-6]WOD06055.1 hypothetical protein ONZ50_09855 [Marinomonas sp. GJ51-6]